MIFSVAYVNLEPSCIIIPPPGCDRSVAAH